MPKTFSSLILIAAIQAIAPFTLAAAEASRPVLRIVYFMPTRGDGRELFRSPRISDHTVHEQTADVSGIDLLELIVEDSGDGNRGDWGVWLDPRLRR